MTPPIVCVVGKKNSGKTLHVVALAAELSRRGRRVMTVKHGHGFDVDRPGSDSWKHRHEGNARRVVLAGPGEMAVFGDWPSGEMSLTDIVDRFLWDAEIVLAEGYKSGPHPRIEIFRVAADPEPIYSAEGDDAGPYLAIATDAPAFEAAFPVLSLDAPDLIASLADIVEEAIIESSRSPRS